LSGKIFVSREVIMKKLRCAAAVGAGLLLLSGCQTGGGGKNIASVEAALEGISVAMPPRDPFTGIDDVPQSLADISGTNDCGKPPKETVQEWLAGELEYYSTRKQNGHTHHIRVQAADAFRYGQPRKAAALAEAIVSWPRYESERDGVKLFTAMFYAGLGDFDKADEFRSDVGTMTTSDYTCQLRNNYWVSRTDAYLSLANGESMAAVRNVERARNTIAELREQKRGDCSVVNKEKWRDQELDVLLAKSFLQMGDLNKAEVYGRTVLKSLIPPYKRAGLQVLSKVKLRQNRFQDALSFGLMTKKSVRKECVALNSLERAENNRDVALAMIALEQFDDAASVLNEVERDLKSESELWKNLFQSSIERAIVLRETGKRDQAVSVMKQAVLGLQKLYGSNHYLTREASMLFDLTSGQVSTNELIYPLRDLLAAWKEQTTQFSSVESNQSIRLRWIVEDYLARVFSENPDEKAIAEAFEVAETLRSGSVQRALGETAIRRLAPSDAVRDTVRRQQNLQKKLGVMRQRYGDSFGYGQVGSGALTSLKRQIADIENAVTKLTADVRSQVPGYDDIAGQGTIDLEATSQAMRPDEAIISLTTGRQATYVWVLTKDGRVSGRAIAKTAEDWRAQVSSIRESLQPVGGQLTGIPKFDSQNAYSVFKEILEPMKDHWSSAKQLVFVLDNDLAALPMALLLTKETAPIVDDGQKFSGFRDAPWLIRTHAVSKAPSVTSFVLLRQGTKGNTKRHAFLGVGDPIFNPREAAQIEVAEAANTRGSLVLRNLSSTRGLDKAALQHLPRLPETANEVRVIADVVGAEPNRDLFIGTRATETTIRKLSRDKILRNYRILSFATHGLIPGDLDGLQSPALALTAPEPNATEKWDDGLLTAEEIMELDLDADWAILSACNTASSGSSSTEAFSGLGQAFFYAGARALLLSNWPVFSDSTRHLMIKLFEHEKKAPTRAQAFQAALLEIIDQGQFDAHGLKFSYAHPLFWAPFSLVGDGG
jgi:CHAT domain-containing protein